MIAETMALSVFANGVYDFIKTGLQLNAGNLRAYFTNQQQPITEQYAQQIIDNIEADNLVQKINNGEITQNNIEQHITNSSVWKTHIDNSTHIQGDMISGDKVIGDKIQGDKLTDHARKISVDGNYIESQTNIIHKHNGTTEKKP